MKKLLALSMVVLLLLGVSSTGFALSPASENFFVRVGENNEGSFIITPFYSHTSAISASLTFSNGKANCSGSVTPSGMESSTITVTLYKKSGSSWNYVSSWSGSATNGKTASAGGSTSVSSGTYKVVAAGNIGGGLEKPSNTVEKTY